MENENNLEPPPRSSHRHIGKVARLPLPIRNLVNQSLRDGLVYREIIARLDALGHRHFTAQNISLWAKGGYQQWLERQENFERSIGQSETNQALLDQVQPGAQSNVASLNGLLISTQLNKVLQKFDTDSLLAVLQAKPGEYLRLVNSIAFHENSRAHCQQVELDRLRYQLELRKIESAESSKKPRGGLSRETLHQIDQALHLL